MDLDSSDANCGACGRSCGAGQTCCNQTCVDLGTDELNCDACGRGCGCSSGQTCCGTACINCGASVVFDDATCSCVCS